MKEDKKVNGTEQKYAYINIVNRSLTKEQRQNEMEQRQSFSTHGAGTTGHTHAKQ